MGPHCWQDVNYSSHSSEAVQGAEILVHARLRKSELIHKACVVKDSGITVHVIRRTKLPIGGAGRAIATGDTVKIALPGPAHSVADGDVNGIRHKTEFVSQRSHCYIKNLAPDVSFSARSLVSVLIDDADRYTSRDFSMFRRHSVCPRPEQATRIQWPAALLARRFAGLLPLIVR